MIELKPYQLVGSEWLAQRRYALLADEMGLGKSAQAITAADEILAEKVMIVCPAVARVNWSREFEKFSTIKREFYLPPDGSKPPPNDHRSLIYSYQMATDHHRLGAFFGQRFDLLILDESHFLKDMNSARSKDIMGVEGLRTLARRVWLLSGTPFPNHIGELWIVMKTFGVTKMGYFDFINTYCDVAMKRPHNKAHWGMKPVGTKKALVPKLRKMLEPIMLRRRKKDVLPELPPIRYNEVMVERGHVVLTEMMQRQVEQELNRLGIAMGGRSDEDCFRILEAMAPSLSTLRRYLGMQKVTPAIDLIIPELRDLAYDKIVIFAIHVEVVAMLRVALKEFNPVHISGNVHPKFRQDMVDTFQIDDTCRVFIGNIQAAGTAITLTRADELLLVEREWTPAANNQAIERVHRIGQERRVNVRGLSVAGSIDEKINAVLRRKSRDISALLGDE